jgi:DNA-binding transcriptional MerR regulator
MERLEYIAEAKKKGFTDSEIQELLNIYEQYAQEGYPVSYEFPDGVLSPDEIDITRAGVPA